jgi:hypothetical protein
MTPVFLAAMSIVAVIWIGTDIVLMFVKKYRWYRGKGPNDHEVSQALICLSCYMAAMQRGLKATKIKSITIDYNGDYDVSTIPQYGITASQPAPVDLKPNRR